MKREVPFSTGFAIILIAAFFAYEFVLSYPGTRELNAERQVALAAAAVTVTPLAISSSELPAAPVSATTIDVTPGLLPVISLAPQKSAKQKTAAAAAPKLTLKILAGVPSAPGTAASTAQIAMTAKAFLAATTLAPTAHGGTYKAVFTTNSGGGSALTWGLDAATLGGGASSPQFSVSYSCDPPPNMPAPGDANQIPTFNVRTSYTCTVSLTPLTGNDRRTQSQSFSFTTGAGPFLITAPPAMNVVLKSGENDGGFVFNNEDSVPVAVSQLALGISYTALNIQAGPLILQLMDPITDAPLAVQHLEDISADPTQAYTHTSANLVIPVSFTINPMTQKMLPVRILGVSPMNISNVNPTVTITLRSIIDDRASGTVATNGPVLSWSCVVPLTAYDPNATSGPFAMGTACQ